MQLDPTLRAFIAVVALIADLSTTAFAGRVGQPANGATIAVTTTADLKDAADSVMSLREAIDRANSTPERDHIVFDLPDADSRTLVLAEPLPQITEPVIIDGYDENERPQSPMVQLDGSRLSARPSGLSIAGGRSVVRGIAITNFGGNGISLTGRGGNVVHGCFIGVAPAAGSQSGNGLAGVFISSSKNVIGGVGDLAPLPRNVIADNGSHGVEISGGDENLVLANIIGVATDRGNAGCGVLIAQGRGNTIGGIRKGEGNSIAANSDAGVRILSGDGNRIASNIVTGNRGFGIDLGPSGPTANDAGDVDGGANRLQNAPVLRRVSATPHTTHVEGIFSSEPNTTYRIELFASARSYEATEFLWAFEVVTDGSGTARIDIVIFTAPGNELVTATATGPNGDTSELSPGIAASGTPRRPATETGAQDDRPIP